MRKTRSLFKCYSGNEFHLTFQMKQFQLFGNYYEGTNQLNNRKLNQLYLIHKIKIKINIMV